MKKLLVLFSCCAFMAACGGSETTEGEDYYNGNGTATGAEATATASQPEADNNLDSQTETVAAGDEYERGKNLIASSDCLSCHQVETRLVGPGYVEVAEKYEFTDENVDYLAGKIIEGGAGVWGQIPMTPHPDLERENAREMAKYILSLRK